MNKSTDKATLLVVDDTPENLAVLCDLLQPHFAVRAANSGARALEVANSTPRPDLILLDIMMPDLDGYAVLSQLQADPATRDIPVIFVSALNESEDERRGFELGAVDYITKPVRPAIVLARVRTHLELKRARDHLRNENIWLEAELQRRNRLRESILASAGEGIYGTDQEGRLSFINPAALALLGYVAPEVLGRPAHETFRRGEAHEPLQACLKGEVEIENCRDEFLRRDGSYIDVEYSCQAIMEGDETLGSVVTFRDIGERLRYLAEIERKSNFDELTGLPNRNLLHDRLGQAIEQAAREAGGLAVLLFNIDRFKTINDSLGHAAGDAVLQQLARRLSENLPGAATLARIEGDQFVLILPGLTDAVSLSRMAQPLLDGLAQPVRVDARELQLSASLGAALYPTDGQDSDTLLRNAEAAMYEAKASGGKHLSFYTAALNARAMERLEVEHDLRHAIDRGELVLHYQPMLSLLSGRIIGAEALVRWQHPERGLISPNQFIPLAEESGLIVPLGEWVLRTACSQNRAWQAAGLPPLPVAVNLSARQIMAQDIVELATRVLQETGLAAQYLELELTESMVMADAEAFIESTQRLKRLSISLLIDDFGTGFSSLSYLNRFAIDRLKIDQSFIRKLTHDPNSAAIAQSIISLAHSLGLSVIAEGVETEAQLGFLCKRYCDEMQGFLFSRPLPAADYEALLRSGRRLELPEPARLANRTLLLVDDDAAVLAALKRLLRREGYTLLEARSGAEGLDLLAKHEVGVVISDARMPEMSGTEFLSRVREIYPDSVRIMLSGYTDLEAVTTAVNRGELFRFLTKPWDDEELLATLRDAFRHHEIRRSPPPLPDRTAS